MSQLHRGSHVFRLLVLVGLLLLPVHGPPPRDAGAEPGAAEPGGLVEPASRAGQGAIRGTEGDAANCRVAPSLDADVIELLSEDSVVDGSGPAEGPWQPVTCAGQPGYVAAQFVSVNEGQGRSRSVAATPGAASGSVLLAAGDISRCENENDEATARLLDARDGVVATLGDNVYDSGSTTEFMDCYDPAWGRHKGRTRPAPGNHDYETSGASEYYDYFGEAAGDPDKGYYSYELGGWHVVVLNSNVERDAGSAQEEWLRADLEANPDACTVAYWHHPRFSSDGTHGSNASMQPLWQVLYDGGVEIALAGHDHHYERFAPLDAEGDVDPGFGIRQFVLGTGGAGHYELGDPLPGSEVRDADTFGILELSLDRGGYRWEFVPVPGSTFTDSGGGTCHGARSAAPAAGVASARPLVAPAMPESSLTVPGGPLPGESLSLPLRAAFYYPWFPGAWTQQGVYPYSINTTSLGVYNGGDPDVLAAHIDAMRYGNIDAGIASWWGPGTREDERMPQLLAAAEGSGFRWATYYEDEGFDNPSVATIQSDLEYLREQYAANPNYLRIDGRFVVFAYGGVESCEMADRWEQANTVDAYVVLKVFSGYRSCASQPDGWHQYAPAEAADAQGSDSYSISPGFHLYGEPERLPRDLARWERNVREMTASEADWQLVTTFNEWGESTAVESAEEWESASGYGAYLDMLHRYGRETSVSASLPPAQRPPAT